MDSDRVIARGNIRDIAGVPMNARGLEVGFRLSHPGSATAFSVGDGSLYPTATEWVTPDAVGDFSVRLVPTDFLSGGTPYVLSIRWDAGAGYAAPVDVMRVYVPRVGGMLRVLPGSPHFVSQVVFAPVQPDPWPEGITWINSITGDVMENRGARFTWLGNVAGVAGAPGKPGAPGAPGVNAVPAQEAVAAYLSDPNSDVFKAVVARIDADRKSFDLAKARVEYGARAMRPTSENRVMQSVQVLNASGEIWYSQVSAGTTGGRESTVIARCSPNGAALGEMMFTDAGHGTGMFIEVDSSGRPWVWLSFINHAISSGNGRYNYVRVPWQSGASYTWSQVSSYRVAALSGTTYMSAHYDELNGEVGIRDNPAEAPGSYRFSRHRIEDLKSGLWDPKDVFDYTPTSDWVGQGWALLDKTWYLLSGTGSIYSPYLPAQVWQLDTSGRRVLVRSIEEIRRSPAGNAIGGFTEPEGLSVARGPKGEPSLMVGVSTGPTGGRAYTFWTVNMGVSPFINQTMTQDAGWGDTGWTPTVVKSWVSGFSPARDALQLFEGRIVGGYLELDGRVNGSFTSGQNVVGTLREGYYSPVKQRRGLATKSMGAGSPSASVRVEINTAGQFSIFLPTGDSTVSWIDFTGFRVPLFIERGVSAAAS